MKAGRYRIVVRRKKRVDCSEYSQKHITPKTDIVLFTLLIE